MYFVETCPLTEVPVFRLVDNGQQKCRRQAQHSSDSLFAGLISTRKVRDHARQRLNVSAYFRQRQHLA
jgi:hypothetical protein